MAYGELRVPKLIELRIKEGRGVDVLLSYAFLHGADGSPPREPRRDDEYGAPEAQEARPQLDPAAPGAP